MPDTTEVRKVISLLKKRHPGKGMLEFRRAEDVLLAVTLSARTRDEQVLIAYPRMRKRFPTLKKLANARVSGGGRPAVRFMPDHPESRLVHAIDDRFEESMGTIVNNDDV